MKSLLENWQKFLDESIDEAKYGKKLFVGYDGEETPTDRLFSLELIASLKSFILDSTLETKKELLSFLLKLNDEIKKGNLVEYMSELKPPTGKVYRGRFGMTFDQAKKEGLFPITVSDPDALADKNGVVQVSSGGTFVPRPSDFTSWTYEKITATNFTAVGFHGDRAEQLAKSGTGFFSVIMETDASEPGFMLNHNEIHDLKDSYEHEVLYIGGPLKLTKVYYRWYEPSLRIYSWTRPAEAEMLKRAITPLEPDDTEIVL
tara:strand:- start:5370 stop:6149 length:780 start_codon:yes stop_codon:yes gene_type:complete